MLKFSSELSFSGKFSARRKLLQETSQRVHIITFARLRDG